MNLKNKTIFGVLWNAFELIGSRLIQLIMIIILAHILEPKDFGVVALLAIFMELSKVLLDSGFSQALIRKEDTNQKDFNSVFYFNIVISIIIYIILYYIAPLISEFYHYPELTDISRVIFLVIIINSFGIVPNAIMTKDINFKVLAKGTILANLFAGIVAIFLAYYYNFGVWALVFQMLLSTFLRVVLLISFSKWKPSLSFSFVSIKTLFIFSRNLLLFGIIDVIASNIQSLLIGKFYTQSDLGFYSQGKRLSDIPSQTLTSIIRNVTYPMLSRINHNTIQLKEVYRKVITLTVFIIFPLMFILIGIGEDFITLILGNKWIPVIKYFILMCLIGAIYPLYSIHQNIFLARGNSSLLLKLSIAQRVITLSVVFITIQFSVLALVIGQVISTTINTLIIMYYAGREINYSMLEQLRDIMGIVFLSLFMLISIYLLGKSINLENLYLTIFIQVFMGLFIYISLAFFLKFKILNEVRDIVFRIRNRG